MDNEERLKVEIPCAGCNGDLEATAEERTSRGKYHCEVVWTRAFFLYPDNDWSNFELSPLSLDSDVGDV